MVELAIFYYQTLLGHGINSNSSSLSFTSIFLLFLHLHPHKKGNESSNLSFFQLRNLFPNPNSKNGRTWRQQPISNQPHKPNNSLPLITPPPPLLPLPPPMATTTTTASSHSPQFHHPEITLSPPPSHDGLEFWQFMVAGSIAGSVEHMAMFPIDTLKTRMQAIGPSCPSSTINLRQSLGSILKLEGPAGLYRGIAAMGLGAGPAHAVYFSVYEWFKKALSAGNPNNSAAHAASGILATVASDAVITPMDVVKQRLQLKGSPYKGVGDCVRRVVLEEGVGAFYKSYRTTVVMNAPFTAVHFATYEAAKRGLMELSPESVGEEDETLVVHATAGAAAGALAAALTTPLDVVKTQLQCQGVCGCDRFSSSSIQDVIATIVKKNGYGGLMRGWVPRMLFHAPAAAICWSTYEAGKTFFQDLNGRSNSSVD